MNRTRIAQALLWSFLLTLLLPYWFSFDVAAHVGRVGAALWYLGPIALAVLIYPKEGT